MAEDAPEPELEVFIPPSPSEFLRRTENHDSEPPRYPSTPNYAPFTCMQIDRIHPSCCYLSLPPLRHYFISETTPNIYQLRPGETSRLLMHYYLRPNPYHPTFDCEIVWDVILPPSHARVWARELFRRYKALDLSLAAFQPSVSTVWILSDHEVLAYWMTRWGPIIVSSESVTVGGILQGIYAYLQISLTREEVHDISSVPGNKKTLYFARSERAKGSHELESVVLANGYKRVDVLGGHRKFYGMRLVVLSDRTWRLYVNFIPGPVPPVG